MPARSPEEVDALFEKALNAGDIDGLVALYEPDATLIPQPGQEAKGRARFARRWRHSLPAAPRST